MARMNIPDKYKKDVENFLKKLEFDSKYEEARKLAYRRATYVNKMLIFDKEYQEAFSEFKRPYVEKYRKEFNRLLKEREKKEGS